MNNPLELLLRRQKAAQGGRIGFFGGGGADMGAADRAGEREARGYGGGNQKGNLGGGNKDRERTDYNANRATTDAALQRMENTGFTTQQAQQYVNTGYDPSQHTHNIVEAMFNPDLTFKYNPQMDYVNRVYGSLRPDQQKRILNRIDPEGNLFGGDFGAFINSNYGNLYDQGNITGQNIKDAFTGAKEYFTGIPSAIANYDPTMPTQEGLVDLAKNVGYQSLFNPAMAVITSNPFSLFGSIVLGKGPYNLAEDGTYNPELGDIANLTNAPANYVNAIRDYNITQGLEGLTSEQMAQVATGMSNQAETQANRRGREMSEEERAELQAQMDAQSTESYKNTLTEQQRSVYDRLQEQNYSDDYIRAYLGFL